MLFLKTCLDQLSFWRVPELCQDHQGSLVIGVVNCCFFYEGWYLSNATAPRLIPMDISLLDLFKHVVKVVNKDSAKMADL